MDQSFFDVALFSLFCFLLFSSLLVFKVEGGGEGRGEEGRARSEEDLLRVRARVGSHASGDGDGVVWFGWVGGRSVVRG